MRPTRSSTGAWLALLGVAAAVSAISCHSSSLAPSDAAARIDGETVRYADFETYLDRSVGLETVLSSEVLSGLLDQFVDELLLHRLARDRGLDVADAEGWEVAEELVRGHATRVADDEVVAYYAANRASFERPERVRLRQILGSERAVVEEVRDRLGRGASFDALMREKTNEVSGREDELSRDDVPVAFADVIFDLEPGEMSEIVSADYGFHLFQVLDRLPAERVGLERATPEIVDRLHRETSGRVLADLVGEARDRYNVEIYQRNLPFNYRGHYGNDNERTAGE